MTKRKVDVFTAGCPICAPTVALVAELACSDCVVAVHDLSQQGVAQARRYGITTVPAVVVDGRLVTCCGRAGPDAQQLRAAGIGAPR